MHRNTAIDENRLFEASLTGVAFLSLWAILYKPTTVYYEDISTQIILATSIGPSRLAVASVLLPLLLYVNAFLQTRPNVYRIHIYTISLCIEPPPETEFNVPTALPYLGLDRLERHVHRQLLALAF